ncbi:MAG: pitrilysin family protein [Mariprofundaceae bacterium]
MNKLRFITFAILSWMAIPGAYAVTPIQTSTLDNGLRILLMEAHGVPMVTMQLMVPAGSRFDTDGAWGSASLLAAMLSDHTAKHDDKAWAMLLDRDAIRFSATADHDSLQFSLTVLSEVLEKGAVSLSEALLSPGWHKKRFWNLKEDAMSSAEKSLEEPGVRAAQATAKAIFGDQHPYGHSSGGDVDSLRKVSLNTLKKLYRDQVKPQGAVLAVSGDTDMATLRKIFNPLFQSWQGVPKLLLTDQKTALPTDLKPVAVKMQTSQTHLTLARVGIARSAPDFFPLFVLNHMLGGGGFASVLMEEVREKRGLVYGVYSYFSPLALPGRFVISLQTRADQADQAEQVVRQVLTDMSQKKLTKKQLQASKANLTGGFPLRLDSNRERAGLIAMIGFYNLPLGYLEQWTDQVASVSFENLQQAAEKYLNPTQWLTIRVGP